MLPLLPAAAGSPGIQRVPVKASLPVLVQGQEGAGVEESLRAGNNVGMMQLSCEKGTQTLKVTDRNRDRV